MQAALELYKLDNGSYPVSPYIGSNIQFTYQNHDGDAFLGDGVHSVIVPKYLNKLPKIDYGSISPYDNTYAYTSNGDDYKLIRLYQYGMPPSELTDVPASMHDPNFPNDRWGVWSAGGVNF
jgi:hypothetical protein